MSVGTIAFGVLCFIGGLIAGVIVISMCFSNERYDDSQASYTLGEKQGEKRGILIGRSQMRDEMMSLCSHCTYKREGQ